MSKYSPATGAIVADLAANKAAELPIRYPKYRLKKTKFYGFSSAVGVYSRRLEAGETCEYFAHSDTYLFESKDNIVPFFDGETVENSKDEFEPVNFFILVGGAEHLDWFKDPKTRRNLEKVEWFWTATSKARKGDEGLIYLAAPVSSIVGRVEFAGDAFHNVGDMFENTIMKNKWCAEIKFREYFEKSETQKIKDLRSVFGADWRWLAYPRGNSIIPSELVVPLINFMRGKYGEI